MKTKWCLCLKSNITVPNNFTDWTNDQNKTIRKIPHLAVENIFIKTSFFIGSCTLQWICLSYFQSCLWLSLRLDHFAYGELLGWGVCVCVCECTCTWVRGFSICFIYIANCTVQSFSRKPYRVHSYIDE